MSEVPVGNVSVTLLNGFSAAVDGVPVPATAWRLKKARELVKLLALAPGHRLHREQAMEALWADRTPDAAANNLHQAVYIARRALDAQAIDVRDETLTLTADVDIEQLQLAAADARRAGTAAAYRAALSLYTGELLPENRYDDWAAERREELEELAGELAAELDALDPDASEGRAALPAETSSFVGRARELVELKALLRGTRLLTLAGTGGAGKTRLALELARSCERSYEGGAVLVELAALTHGALVTDAVASALDVRALSGQQVIDVVIDFLAPRSLLLVLDNCEHLLAPTARLADTLLRSAPELTILATSREPLRVSGEVVFRVPSLDIPDPEQTLRPRQLLHYEAVQLFVDRAQAGAPQFTLDEHNAADVARICFRLDGLPLALELAAGRLGALDTAAIAERLDDRFRVLRSGSHASPTRQQTLSATLQWSHELLEQDERALFRRLAAFTGGFELGAVEIVCAGGELEDAGTADVLARLVEKSLVAIDERFSPERRYRLLETVRLYARERLQEAGETATIAARHASWALALAERERGSPRLDREAANLREALDELLLREAHDALRMCVALGPFWLRRIDLQEAQRRFDEVLAASAEPTALRAEALLSAAALDFRSGTISRGIALAEDSYAVASELADARAEWRALQLLGEFGIANDAAEVALGWFDRALALATREGFAASRAICVYSRGVARWVSGDLEGAEELVAQGIELLGALAGSDEWITSPLNIAESPISQPHDRPGVRMAFEDTLQPFLEISCAAATSYALANQAAIARARGELGRARALLEQSAARFQAAGDEPGVAAVLVRRAYLDLGEGELSPARAALEQALELRRGHSDRRGLGLVLAGLGLIETSDGDYRNAERRLGEAREIFRRAGDRWGLASTLWRTAELALARDRLEEAESALQEALTVLADTRRARWIANTLAGLAEVALLRGDRERARAHLIEARDRYAAGDDARGVANVEGWLRGLAKEPLRAGKEAPDRTTPTSTRKGRRT